MIPITQVGAQQVYTAESSIYIIPTNLPLHPPPPLPHSLTLLHVIPSVPCQVSDLELSHVFFFFWLPQVQAKTVLPMQCRYKFQLAKEFHNHAHLSGSELIIEHGFSYICRDK